MKKVSSSYTVALCGAADVEESDLRAKLQVVADELDGSLKTESE
jgi:hypothetical protein